MSNGPSAGEIYKLTSLQRELLIEHIDGPIDVSVRKAHMIPVRNSLIGNGMLRGDSSGPHMPRPRTTILTDYGRHAVAAILSMYAEALVKAGMLEARPIDVLAQLKSRPAVSAHDALLPARMAIDALRK